MDLSQENIKKLRKADTLIQYYQNLEQHRKNIEFFQIMSQHNEIIYIDQQKTYAVVKSSYVKQLQQVNSKSKDRIEKITQEIKNQQLNKALFNKIFQLKQQQIGGLKNMISKLQLKNQQLERIIADQESLLNQKQQQIKITIQKYENQLIQVQAQAIQSLSRRNQSNKQEKQVQTHYEYDYKAQHGKDDGNTKNTKSQTKNAQQNVQNTRNNLGSPSQFQPLSETNKSELLVQKYESQILMLKSNFQKIINQIGEKAQQKIGQLQQQKINIEHWSQQNKNLRKENQKLKQTINQINEKQEKLKIWKNVVENFVDKVDKQYSNKQPSIQNIGLPNQNVGLGLSYVGQQKIQLMQSTIDRLQAEQRQRNEKLSQIKKMIDFEQEGRTKISDQNIVGNILNLSLKVKQAVRFLLEDM